MVNFSLDPDMVPNLKLGLHSIQIIFSFVAWVLEIIVLNDANSKINGQIGWAFAVCFLSIPAWIFLIMTPRWQRSRRFAEPHAMLLVDAIFTIFWLSAFACQAAFNSADRCGGRCSLSKGVVGMGVFVTFFWIATTLVSVYTLKHYQFHGILPGYDRRPLGGGGGVGGVSSSNYDPDKTAFSMAPDGDEPYARVDGDDPDHHHAYDQEHLPHLNDDDYLRHGNTGYGGASSLNSRFGPADSALDSDLSGGYGGASSVAPNPSGYPSRDPTPLFDNSRFSPRPEEAPYEPGYNSRIASPAIHHGNDAPYDDDPARFPAGNYHV